MFVCLFSRSGGDHGFPLVRGKERSCSILDVLIFKCF